MRSLIWAIFLSLGACQSPAPPSRPTTPLSIPLDTTAVVQAFRRLSRDTAAVTRHTYLLSTTKQILGWEVQQFLFEPRMPPRLLRAQRGGTFPKLPFLKAPASPLRTSQALLHSLWPQPLPFVQPRYRSLYHYYWLNDTLVAGHRLRRLEITPVDTQRAQALWQGVLYLTVDHQVVGAELSRTLRTLFGQEYQYIGLQLLPDRRGFWRLASEQLALEIHPPGLSPYRLCLHATYTYPPFDLNPTVLAHKQ